MAGFDTAGFKYSGFNNASGTVSPYMTGADGVGDGSSAWEYLDDGTDFWMFGVNDDGYFWTSWFSGTYWLMIGAY